MDGMLHEGPEVEPSTAGACSIERHKGAAPHRAAWATRDPARRRRLRAGQARRQVQAASLPHGRRRGLQGRGCGVALLRSPVVA